MTSCTRFSAPEAYWPIRRVGAEFHSAADGAQALSDIAAELEASDAPDTPDAMDPSTAVQTPADSIPSSLVRADRDETGAALALDGLGYRILPVGYRAALL